jgi:hypothetical protein
MTGPLLHGLIRSMVRGLVLRPVVCSHTVEFGKRAASAASSARPSRPSADACSCTIS